jgi:3-methyl-2-oxobutanoate hydroxymethyltransferase
MPMSAQGPSGGAAASRPKTTAVTLQEKRDRGEPIAMITAYDYPTARIADAAGFDAILVGDSLAMVVLGHPNTLSVSMDEMLHHARAVSRGATGALLVGDLPFMSYQASREDAVRNAGRFLQEGGMDAVKMEGGRPFVEAVQAIVRSGIPVQGHIGLTPQSVKALGGFRVQGRTADAAHALIEDAVALEDAGCFSIVLESVPDRLGKLITERLSIPTIGIGAGPATSGQVLVLHDVVGMFEGFTPRFARRYAELGASMGEALRAFRADIASRAFPAREQSYSMPEEEWQALLATLDRRLPGPRGRRPRPARG